MLYLRKDVYASGFSLNFDQIRYPESATIEAVWMPNKVQVVAIMELAYGFTLYNCDKIAPDAQENTNPYIGFFYL